MVLMAAIWVQVVAVAAVLDWEVQSLALEELSRSTIPSFRATRRSGAMEEQVFQITVLLMGLVALGEVRLAEQGAIRV